MNILKTGDVLFIEKMSIDLFIGAFPEEKTQKQPCEISVLVEVDTMPLKNEDCLSKTYDYGTIVALIRSLSTRTFELVETLAAEIAEGILKDSRVKTIEVTIAKLGAFSDVKRCGCKRVFSR